jgi:hypothetical protein
VLVSRVAVVQNAHSCWSLLVGVAVMLSAAGSAALLETPAAPSKFVWKRPHLHQKELRDSTGEGAAFTRSYCI